MNLFDPVKIVITGGIIREKGYIIEELKRTATHHSLNSNFKNLIVIVSTTLSNEESVGAASLWIDTLYRGELEFDYLKRKSYEDNIIIIIPP